MSTFKKWLEYIAVIAVFVFVGVYIVNGKINFLESWFGERTLQVSLGSILFILLFVYISKNRNDLSPNNLRSLLLKTKIVLVLIFSLLLWIIVSRPTNPVNVSFEGVAKTFDVIETQKAVQKTNKNVRAVSDLLSDFKDDQQERNDEIKKIVSALQSKIANIDADDKVKQQAILENLSEISGSVSQIKLKTNDKNQEVKSESGSNFSDLIIILVVLVCISVASSFFWKNHTKFSVRTRRWVVPVILIVLIIGLYYYPAIRDQFSYKTDTNLLVKDDSTVKKVLPFVIDTIKVKNNTEVPAQEILPEEENTVDTKLQLEKVKIISKKKSSKKKLPVRYTSPKNRVPVCLSCSY
ncbi:MAG: hypothetical protein KBC11_00785 [Candidatus Pacebacteria bacterium]|nr:hypothetical protein [Candidatus Paceibacterota bacterium]